LACIELKGRTKANKDQQLREGGFGHDATKINKYQQKSTEINRDSKSQQKSALFALVCKQRAVFLRPNSGIGA
jgi:hypothetical protein